MNFFRKTGVYLAGICHAIESIHHNSIMRNILFKTALSLTAVVSGLPAAGAAVTPEDIIAAMRGIDCYRSKASFSVTMPQLNDDIVYSLDLFQKAAPADSLLPCDYLIDWTMTSREDPIKGFTAYFDGNHYRYAGERLQEFHMKWDPVPFSGTLSGNDSPKGVQRTAQFANLLPATIAEELERIMRSDRYKVVFHPDTIVAGRKCIAIEAVMRLKGVIAMEATYTFDPSDYLPLFFDFENNPGSLSEQTVTVRFSDSSVSSGCQAISEESLMKQYPEVFERFRESDFRIENLPGSRMPGFALPTTTGERYMRRSADRFASPTIITILDASHAYTPETVSQLRQACDALPFNTDLIMAFVDKHVDAIEAIVPRLRTGEHLLMGASPLARDCGAASLPAVILTDTTGTVRDVIVGMNNDLASDVIQKMVLISQNQIKSPDSASSKKTTDNQNEIITSMETVHFKNTPCHTYGTLPAVGSKAPEFSLTGADLSTINSGDYKGKTIVLNIFPSLDTEVCARSVRRFNEEAGKLDNTAVICVSEDLPFAMSRFCTIEGLQNVTPASAFRSPMFGEKYGVMLVDGPLADLLTRAVIIIGPDGTVRYRDLVNEITDEPDYEAAIRVLTGKY